MPGNSGKPSGIDGTFYFLPAVTANTSREIGLQQSSARSHLAKTLHQRKKVGTKPLQYDENIDATTKSPSRSRSVAKDADMRNISQRVVSAQYSLRAMPEIIVDSHTKMLLYYCTQFFWPGFEMGSAAFHFPPFAVDYNALVSQGPALVHAVLWQAAVSQAIRRKSRITDKSSLWHYNQAINYISRDISKPVSEIPEQTMYAILSLTGSEISPDNENIITKRAFDPPLAKLSWIHVFGSRLHIDTHAKALMRLVDLKGGIHNLKVAGFQASYNYMDLTRATQRLIKPHLPVSRIYSRVITTHDRAKIFGYASYFAHESDHEDSSGYIHTLRGLGLSDELREVMFDMKTWVKIIEAYQCGYLRISDPSLLTAHRDLIQQRLLATLPEEHDGATIIMPEENEDDQDKLKSWINELVQTALLIFSLGVTFPITYAPPYHRLAKRLQNQIERHRAHVIDLGLSDFLIWLGLLGALCAEQVDDERRKWYIQYLITTEEKRASTPKSRDWEMVRQESLEPFLWSTTSCDTAAKVVWGEVQEKMQKRSGSWETIAWPNMLGTLCG
ncbi:uncharacterized protein FTOL_05727 [Fusarium torulosum]|uniref:Uncharacterized protein n=1 Tax=Fusarium torulosum TaxID=33205 RepID=A0AAE8M7W1_9HYPO|nr:uncharacterized protein FTOL_05727 [Fusarium torulosum]